MAESAVVGVHDELTGQAVNAFVAIKDGNEINDALRKELILQVRKSIGPFAAPKAVFIVPDLPKTRSGKIMRRILRKILAGEEDQLGDTTTVCCPRSIFSPFCSPSPSSLSRSLVLTGNSFPTRPSSTRSLPSRTRARRNKRAT